MKIKVKLIDENIKTTIPKYQKDGDAGLDLVATSIEFTDDFIEYGTNLAIEVPKYHVGLIYPRSSISKYDQSLCNSVGVVDSNYRGEVKLRFKFTDHYNPNKMYNVGDRIGQLIIMPIPKIELELVSELSDTNRGDKAWGSSGQ